MSNRLLLALTAPALALLALTACAGPAGPSGTPGTESAPAADAHGEITGAVEVSEPPLQLVSVDTVGAVGILDLIDGTATSLGSIAPPSALASDGRYVFATTVDGVEVIDSGAWTWDHVDHFHYYRAEPTVVGTVEGSGPATIVTGLLSTAGSTGVFLAGSGEAVLLDNEALSRGEIVESFRITADALVAPWGDGALVGDGDLVRFHQADGTATDTTAECVDPQGAITTRVGVVVGCADGAVLATADGDEPAFERIALPDGADAPRPTSFEGRKGRPTIAGLAGDRGFWLLDTREQTWKLVETSVPLVRVTAVDDDGGHVVGLDADGRVHVFADDGAELAVTAPVVTDVVEGVAIAVDGQRAYVNDPARGIVSEIAYADGARIARELSTPTHADRFAEVGR